MSMNKRMHYFGINRTGLTLVIFAMGLLFSFGTGAAESKNGKPLPPKPTLSGQKSSIVPSPVTRVPSSTLIRQQPTIRLPGNGSAACQQSARRNVSFVIQSDGKNVSGAKISIKRINADLSLAVIVNGVLTFGGTYTVSGLCPGNYVADLFGSGEGGLIRNKRLYYQMAQQRFRVPGNSRITINLEKVWRSVTINRVNRDFPRHRITQHSGYKMPQPAVGVRNLRVRAGGQILAELHCCERYTFIDAGSSTHQTHSPKDVGPRIQGAPVLEYDWHYVPLFVMPNILGERLSLPLSGEPTSDFKGEWGVDFDYITTFTQRQDQDMRVKSQSIPYRCRVPYGSSVIINVYRHRE